MIKQMDGVTDVDGAVADDDNMSSAFTNFFLLVCVLPMFFLSLFLMDLNEWHCKIFAVH